MKKILKIGFFLSIFIFLIGLAQAVKAETRYMRSDDVLGTTQTSSGLYVHISDSGTQYLGIRVWSKTSIGVETEIGTPGTVKAIASGNSTGLISATWAVPATPLNPTDSIVVRVYADNFNPPTTLMHTFTTEPLDSYQLNAATWTVYYDLALYPVTGYFFEYGNAASNSRIEGYAACTNKDPIVTLTPNHTGNPGDTKIYTVNVKNDDTTSCAARTFSLSAVPAVIPAGWNGAFNLLPIISIAPQITNSSRTFSVTSAATAAPGIYNVSVTASGGGFQGTGTATYTVTAPVCTNQNPTVTLTPNHTGNPGDLKSYTINVTNNDTGACAARGFSFSGIVPLGWPIGVFTQPGVNVAPGPPNSAASYRVTSAATAAPGIYNVSVTASGGGFQGTGTATYTVTAPVCTCNAWVNNACGVAGCTANQRHQARTCNPPGCDVESQCVIDPACAPPPPSQYLINPLACNTIPGCIEKIISFIFWIAVAIVPIMIIIAGFLFLTSGGDPEKVRTAKRIIFWTVIGLAMVLFAKGIISLIKTVIEG